VALGFVVLFALPAVDARSSPRVKRVRSAQSALTFAGDIRTRRTAGEITMKVDDRRLRRELVVIRVRGLQPRTTYGVFADDPSTADPTQNEVATFTTNGRGRATVIYDSRRGDRFPFGATIDQLAGTRFEIRDARRLILLAGTAPDPDGVQLKDASACRFIETSVFSDNFDADAVGAAPTGWTVVDTEIVVDDAVKDGATGASARITDSDAVTAAPQMSHGFGAESAFFGVDFTLISSPTNGRVVFQLGDDSGGPTVFAAGLGSGLGFYEDGTIGFGIGDAIISYAPSNTYRFRVDVDMAAKKFDVLINGTKVVTGRDLLPAGTSLDRIEFGGAAATTGTAHVDSVNVVHKTPDCPPTANAGADRTIEGTGPTTAVTLDGSASADPEGAPLTYTWTGDFVEGTASGAAPTVHFTLGTHVVTLVVNDGFFDSAPDTVTIVIQDTTPPVLTVTGLPTTLSPPNHELIHIQPTVTAVDLVDPNPTLTLVITSNEADDSIGDGSTTGDIVATKPDDFYLRAERSGNGSGRIYHLVWTATDHSGNSSTFAADIVVPHDQGQGQGEGDDDEQGDDDAQGDEDHAQQQVQPTAVQQVVQVAAPQGGEGGGSHGHGKSHGNSHNNGSHGIGHSKGHGHND
jgi:hypothetical protein